MKSQELMWNHALKIDFQILKFFHSRLYGKFWCLLRQIFEGRLIMDLAWNYQVHWGILPHE